MIYRLINYIKLSEDNNVNYDIIDSCDSDESTDILTDMSTIILSSMFCILAVICTVRIFG